MTDRRDLSQKDSNTNPVNDHVANEITGWQEELLQLNRKNRLLYFKHNRKPDEGLSATPYIR